MSLVTKLEGFIMPLFHLYSVICKAKKKTERKKDRKTERQKSIYPYIIVNIVVSWILKCSLGAS